MELTPVPGAESRYDDDGNEIVLVATCGHCGRSWNDAAISSVTPTPSARCPFEYEHTYDEDDEDGGEMTNQEALDLLADFTEAASRAVQISTWAQAFLTEGGEPTWDAVKDVASIATTMAHLGSQVSVLTEHYDDITPF